MYGTMTVGGLGVGLLGTFMSVAPILSPLNLGVHIAAPLCVTCTRESLTSEAIRRARNWLAEVFSSSNPWFGREVVLDPAPSIYDVGLRKVFSRRAAL